MNRIFERGVGGSSGQRRFCPGVIVVVAVMVVAVAPAAHANVSLTNGNYYTGYDDVDLGHGLKIERIYNSKSSFSGMFGFGWGDDYEARLDVLGDGSVAVHENGGGAVNLFRAPDLDSEALNDTVETIVRQETAEGRLETKAAREKRRQLLLTSDTVRTQAWTDLAHAGKLSARKLRPGTTLRSYKFGEQRVVRTPVGYRRYVGTDEVDTFDDQGRLTGIQDDAGDKRTIVRDAGGRIAKIVDQDGRTLLMRYNADNLVTSILYDGKTLATYSYQGTQLVHCVESDGDEYGYRYDARFNLVGIRYGDGTTTDIYYRPASVGEQVRWIKDRGGDTKTYEYADFPNGYSTRVTTRSGNSKSTAYYEWHTRNGKTSKTLTDIDGERTVTEYDTHCGLPLRTQSAGRVAVFRYDEHCNVTYKDDGQMVSELTYWQGKKVSHVKRWWKGEPDTPAEEEFYEYNPSGDLVRARNNKGLEIKLKYDARGRIAKLHSGAGVLAFKYGPNGKPVEIDAPGTGKLVVEYNDDGDIKSVKASGGKRDVANKVTMLFQRLLDLIRPAGVTLSL